MFNTDNSDRASPVHATVLFYPVCSGNKCVLAAAISYVFWTTSTAEFAAIAAVAARPIQPKTSARIPMMAVMVLPVVGLRHEVDAVRRVRAPLTRLDRRAFGALFDVLGRVGGNAEPDKRAEKQKTA